nr:helix-turn-helix domain-containing protein [Streptomyces sp. TLI_235]
MPPGPYRPSIRTSGAARRGTCSTRSAGKWAVLVLGELGRNGASWFIQLRQALAGVSEKMLTQTLRTLERGGLVSRTVYPEVPPHVEYELTALGRTLREPLKALTEWSVRHIEEVITAREEYDGRTGRSRQAAAAGN